MPPRTAPMLEYGHHQTNAMPPSNSSLPLAQAGEFIELLAALGTDATFEKGAVVVREGEPGGNVFVIRSGRVQVYSTASGDRQVLIDQHGAGDYFGEMSLDGHPRSASVRVIERAVISVISREHALAFIKQHPEMSLSLIFELAHRVRLATDNFKNLALFDVYGRVSRLLLGLATQSAGAQIIAAMPTQAEIGQRVGASREMVGIILRDLETGGYITRSGRSATIRKPLPKRW